VSDTVTCHGVVTDSQLTFADNVKKLAGSCFYYQVRQLRAVRRSLTTDAATTLVHALISSRVYYCNSVLYGICEVHLRPLQSVLNTAAFDHITKLSYLLTYLPFRISDFRSIEQPRFRWLWRLAEVEPTRRRTSSRTRRPIYFRFRFRAAGRYNRCRRRSMPFRDRPPTGRDLSGGTRSSSWPWSVTRRGRRYTRPLASRLRRSQRTPPRRSRTVVSTSWWPCAAIADDRPDRKRSGTTGSSLPTSSSSGTRRRKRSTSGEVSCWSKS